MATDFTTFIGFIGIYPKKVSSDFRDDNEVLIEVLENDLNSDGDQRTIVFRVKNTFHTVDLWNAMAAGMKETYPVNYDFHSGGFCIMDHHDVRIAEVTTTEQNENNTSREVIMTICLTSAGKNHKWSQSGQASAKTIARIEELKNTLKDDAPWGSFVNFLDTINTIEELEELAPTLRENGEDNLLKFYRDNLSIWVNPQLPTGFQEECPLLSSRLDTPQKIRILLRGAAFRAVDPLLMGIVLEDIIRQHEIEGKQKVVYPDYRGGKRGTALRIVYHTQLQAWTLIKLALPGHTSTGTSDSGLFIKWGRNKNQEEDGNSQ